MSHDPSAGQPRNQGRYAERVRSAPDLALEAETSPSDLVQAAVKAAADLREIDPELTEETSSLKAGMLLASTMSKQLLETGQALNNRGQDYAAAEYAMAHSGVHSAMQGLSAAATYDEGLEALDRAEQRMKSLTSMLEMAKGEPLKPVQASSAVIGEIRSFLQLSKQ